MDANRATCLSKYAASTCICWYPHRLNDGTVLTHSVNDLSADLVTAPSTDACVGSTVSLNTRPESLSLNRSATPRSIPVSGFIPDPPPGTSSAPDPCPPSSRINLVSPSTASRSVTTKLATERTSLGSFMSFHSHMAMDWRIMSERRRAERSTYARTNASAAPALLTRAASSTNRLWFTSEDAGKKDWSSRAMCGTPSVSMKLASRAKTRRSGAGAAPRVEGGARGEAEAGEGLEAAAAADWPVPDACVSLASSASSVDVACPRTSDSNSSRHDATITGLSSSNDLVSARASLTPASKTSESSTKHRSKNAPGSSPSFVTLASTSAPVFLIASASLSSRAMNAAPTRPRVAVSTTSDALSPNRISGTSRLIPLRSAAICANAAIRPLAGVTSRVPAPPARPRLTTAKYLWSSVRPSDTSGSLSLNNSAYSPAVSLKSSRKVALSDTTNALGSVTADVETVCSASPKALSMATARDAR